jgi:hypothetical protein
MTSSSANAPPQTAFVPISSHRSLVGAHPGALARLFAAGRPTDPADLGHAGGGAGRSPQSGGREASSAGSKRLTTAGALGSCRVPRVSKS